MSAHLPPGTYGLSSHLPADKTVAYLKLTDSSLKALEDCYKNKKSKARASIELATRERGCIQVTNEDGGMHKFSFTTSKLTDAGPQSEFQCIQRTDKLSLLSLGRLQQKISIHANEDVYEATNNKIKQRDEESRKACTKVLENTNSGPNMSSSKRVHKSSKSSRLKQQAMASLQQQPKTTSAIASTMQAITASSHAAVTSSTARGAPHSHHHHHHHHHHQQQQPNVTTNNNNNNTILNNPQVASKLPPGNPEVLKRPLRDRIVHLLAIRPYKKVELKMRLMKDGIQEKDNNKVQPLLEEVAVLKDKTLWCLTRDMYSQVNPDWPFYTSADRHLLKQELATKMSPSSSSSGGSLGQPSPSNSPTSTTSNPCFQQKRSYPQAPAPYEQSTAGMHASAKRTRISPEQTTLLPHVADPGYKITCNNNPGYTSLTPPPDQKTIVNVPAGAAAIMCSPAVSPDSQASPKRHPSSQPWMTKPILVTTKCVKLEVSPPMPSSTSVSPDYIRTFSPVTSIALRQKYKDAFNRDYDEYRRLHASMAATANRFKQLEEEMKKMKHGSVEFNLIKEQILREYMNSKQDSKYVQTKQRWQYLHAKLSHIKEQVQKFDLEHILGGGGGEDGAGGGDSEALFLLTST